MRIEIPLRTESKLVGRSQQFVGMHRNIDIRSPSGIDAEEPGRRHTQHSEGEVVDQNRLADSIGSSSEALFAQGIADDGDSRRSRPIVVRNDEPAGRREDGESAEIVAGYGEAGGKVSLSLDREVQLSRLPRLEIGEHAREDRIVFLEQFERLEGEHAARCSRFGVAPTTAAHRSHDEVAPGVGLGVPIQDDQRLGIRNRQRAQQDRIHEAVDRRIGADAQRQTQNHQCCEQPVGSHGPEGVAHVLAELLDDRPSPHGAGVLVHEREIAQLATRRRTGVFL